jgi:hypothetical protein
MVRALGSAAKKAGSSAVLGGVCRGDVSGGRRVPVESPSSASRTTPSAAAAAPPTTSHGSGTPSNRSLPGAHRHPTMSIRISPSVNEISAVSTSASSRSPIPAIRCITFSNAVSGRTSMNWAALTRPKGTSSSARLCRQVPDVNRPQW